MRDLLVLAALMALIPMAMSSTFVAYLLWCWAGLIGLNGYLYGFLKPLPFVQIFAILTLVLLFAKTDKLQQKFVLTRTGVLYVLLGLQAFFVALFAYEGLPRNWETFSNIVKTLLFCAVMPMLVNSRVRLHALLIIVVIGFSFHGILDGLKFIASAGSHNARGVVKFGDNNYLALALGTVLPVSIYLSRYTQNKWIRWGFVATSLLTVLAVISTHSRGGLLTLLAIAAWLIWHSKRKVSGVIGFMFCLVVVVSLAPSAWTERMNTIQSADGDQSFMGRVAVWKKSTAIALEHPLAGGGFFAVQSEPVYLKFKDSPGLMGFIQTPDPGVLAAHSIYFQVMSDMGFLGLLIYGALFLNLFLTRMQLLKEIRASGLKMQWAVDLANCLAASALAFLVGGAALSAAYLEIPFLMIGLMEVTALLVRRNQLKT